MARRMLIGALAGTAVLGTLLAAAAGAAERTLKGPTTVRGSGFLRVEVTRSGGTRAVTLRTNGEAAYVLPISDNVSVTCTGGSTRQGSDSNSKLPANAVICRGATAGVSAKGDHFRVTANADSYMLTLPRGFIAELGQRSGRPNPPGAG
jgi:hypothetical protein